MSHRQHNEAIERQSKMKSVFISIFASTLGFFLAFALGKSAELSMGSFQADTGLVLGLFGILAGYSLSTVAFGPSRETVEK